jgi:hypothetical protein
MNDPFAFGAITARTSQVAPPLATPNVVRPAAPVAAPDSTPVATPAPAPSTPMAVLLAALVIAGVAALAVVRIARRRHAAGPTPRSA